MAYDWSQIGAREITNLFLYGTLIPPADLTADSLIRLPVLQSIPTVEINMASFMASGPGRFANGSQSSIVDAFMSGKAFQGRVPGTRQVFSKTDMGLAFNLSFYGINIQQSSYVDATDHLGLRTYIYNSSQYKISDNARFVIESDGTRHITI